MLENKADNTDTDWVVVVKDFANPEAAVTGISQVPEEVKL